MIAGQTIVELAGGLCSLLMLTGYGYERISEHGDEKRNPAPGRLLSVGQHRLHIFSQGSDGPTVVIEQGAGEPSTLWWPIQQKIAAFAREARGAGLQVHAGHGLTVDNVAPIAAIPEIVELNIGHAIIGRAVFVGLAEAVAEMRRAMAQARRGLAGGA